MKILLSAMIVLLSFFNVNAAISTKIIGTPREDVGTCIRKLPDGSSIIGGYIYDDNNGQITNSDIFILKVDIGGGILWQQRIGIPNKDEFLLDMLISTNNTIYGVGYSLDPASQKKAAIIMQIDFNGNVLNFNSLQDNNTVYNQDGEIFHGLTELANGDIIAVGVNNDAQVKSAGLICVYDQTLNYKYHEVINKENYSDEFLKVTPDGNDVYIVGFVSNNDKLTKYHDARITKYTPNFTPTSGAVLFDLSYDFDVSGSYRNNYGYEIYIRNNTLMVSGIVSSDCCAMDDSRFFVMKTNLMGGFQDIKVMRNQATDIFANVTKMYPMTPNRIFFAEHPNPARYDPLFSFAPNNVDAIISDFSIGFSTPTTTKKFTVPGHQSILDIQEDNGILYATGVVRSGPAALFGNRDIYFIQATHDLTSIAEECSLEEYTYTIDEPTSIGVHIQTLKSDRSFSNIQLPEIVSEEMNTENFCGDVDQSECYAEFSVSGKTITPYVVSVDATAGGTGSSWTMSWDYGDGNSSNTAPPYHTYTYGSFQNYRICQHKSGVVGQECKYCMDICLNEPVVTDVSPDPSEPSCFPPYFDWLFFGGTDITISIPNSFGPTYNIDFGDGTVISASPLTNYLHNYSLPGTYNVCVDNGNPNCKVCLDICRSEEYAGNGSGNKIGNSTTDIKDIATSSSIMITSIKPNPTTSNTYVDIACNANTKIEYYIIDLTGRMISKNTQQLKSGDNKITISLDGLNSGIYILSVNDGLNTIREKIVKH